jgi:serine/threonine protein kinase
MAALACQACGKALSVRPEWSGKRVVCPACQAVVSVPLLADDPSSRPSFGELRTEAPQGNGDLATSAPSSPEQKTCDSEECPPEHDSALTSFLADKKADDELGRLGGFRILKILGHGGMGVVFLGEDPKLARKVAVKTMLPYLAARPRERDRFLREARLAAALEHDHIVPILHVGEDRGVPFIVMPFLRGESLESRLQREPLAMAEVVQIGRQTVEALAFAHEHGMVHRDIKPANLWLESRGKENGLRVKILDFGLARLAAHDEQNLTQTGALLGTPGYMAPEQADGLEVDGRADVFSLGCVLYRLTTGKSAFPGQSLMAKLKSLANVIPSPAHSVNASTPQRLSDLIDNMLAKDCDARPTAAEVIERLQAIDVRPALSKGTIAAGEAFTDSATATLALKEQPDADERTSPMRVSRTLSPKKRILWIAVGVCMLGAALLVARSVIFRTSSPKEPALAKNGNLDAEKQPAAAIDFAAERKHAQDLLTLGDKVMSLDLHRPDGKLIGDVVRSKELPEEPFYVGAFDAAGLADEDLKLVARCQGLERLTLVDSRGLTDASVLALKNLRTLRHINLGGTPIGDQAAAALFAANPLLEGAELGDTKISAKGLEAVGQCSRLKQLVANPGGPLQGLCKVLAVNCPDLQLVALSPGNQLDLDALKALPRLQHLLISGDLLDDARHEATTARLAAMPVLQNLDLYPRVDAVRLARLKPLGGRLRGLSIVNWSGDVGVPPEGWKHLQGFDSLAHLHIGDPKSSLDGPALRGFAKLSSLQQLELGFEPENATFTRADVEALRAARAGLRIEVRQAPWTNGRETVTFEPLNPPPEKGERK